MSDPCPKWKTMSIERIIPQATYDKTKDQIVAKRKYPRLKLTGVVSDSLILPSLWRAVFALVLLVAPVRGVAKSPEITILIFEDTNVKSNDLTRLLEEAGYKVVITKDVIDYPKIGAIILNLEHPDQRGLSTLKSFAEMIPEVPVIVIAGSQGHGVEVKELVEFLTQGAFAFVTRPYNREELLTTVARATRALP